MEPYWSNGIAELHQADARAIPLPDGSVHCVVTSPPYWGLRDYGIDATGIGLEPTLSEWLANIVAVSREVWRVLRDDGSFWLNLGDAYSGSSKGTGEGGSEKQRGNRGANNVLHPGKRTTRGSGSGRWGLGDTAVDGLPAKNLMGQPWRAAFALQDDGWILRSAIVWHKPNPMPESVSDRPTSAYEMVFLLTKRAHYFYDAEAVREAYIGEDHGGSRVRHKIGDTKENRRFLNPERFPSTGRNARNVWQIPTQGRPEAHFATFPDELPRRCILAGTKEGDTVLDPFVGSGTTVAVAQQLGRRGIGLDLNTEYLKIAQQRIEGITLPLPMGGSQWACN